MNIAAASWAIACKPLARVWLAIGKGSKSVRHICLQHGPIELILHPMRSRLIFFGLVMLLGNPLYHWIWAYVLPQPYENFAARLAISMLGAVLLLPRVNRAPDSHCTGLLFVGVVWIQLPVFFSWMYLCNGGSPEWMASVVSMVLIWYLLTDWRIATLGLVLATVVAWGLFNISAVPAMQPWSGQKVATHGMVIGFAWMMAVLSGVFSANAKRLQMNLSKAHALQGALQSLAGSIAHEMRNPLGQIQHALSMSAELLPEERGSAAVLRPEPLQELHHHLRQGQVAIKRGLQVIDMTLDEVNFRPMDPSRFVPLSASATVQKALDEYGFESVAQRGRVSLVKVHDFEFKGHETAVIFVLFNLLRNALYYFKQCPDAGITITIDRPCIRVKDTGPGIAEEVRARLFDAFQTAGKADGTGLGLAYCHRTMSAFGGRIVCDSVPGQYTEFTLHFVPLTVQERLAHLDQQSQEARARWQGRRVLLLGEGPGAAEVRRCLAVLACSVREVGDAQLARQTLETSAFELMLVHVGGMAAPAHALAAQIQAGALPFARGLPLLACLDETAAEVVDPRLFSGVHLLDASPSQPIALAGAMQAAQANAQAATPAGGLELRNKTLLVADDVALNRGILCAHAQRWGMRVLQAEHGHQVLAMLQAPGVSVDVLVLDMHMPGMGGVEVTRILRATTDHRTTPIVALTGNTDEHSRQMAFDAGMDDFVSKPFDAVLLRQKLSQLLARRQTPGSTGPAQAPGLRGEERRSAGASRVFLV